MITDALIIGLNVNSPICMYEVQKHGMPNTMPLAFLRKDRGRKEDVFSAAACFDCLHIFILYSVVKTYFVNFMSGQEKMTCDLPKYKWNFAM